MGLRDRKEQASQTSKATKKIGLVAKLVLEAGIAPFGRGITNAIKADCFRPYGDRPEQETRDLVTEATERAIQYLPITTFQVGPVLSVRVVKDTNMTPTSRWKGNMYSMKDYDASDRFTHKRHSDFILTHMSDEINDLEGKEFWGHVAWKNLPQSDEYGGDYTKINAENSDELSIIITYLENKRAATELVKALREGTTTVDDLCRARGYDVDGIRKAIGETLGQANKEGDRPTAPTLSDIGSVTKVSYQTLARFTNPRTIKFLKENLPGVNGDLDALSKRCGADVGDVAIVLEKPEYFRAKMEETGKGEQEALVIVAKETGLANVADLASFLGIEEPAF